MTLNVDEELLTEVVEAHPGVTKTALVERGLRALLAQEAAERLARMGGSARGARRAKRSAWKSSSTRARGSVTCEEVIPTSRACSLSSACGRATSCSVS